MGMWRKKLSWRHLGRSRRFCIIPLGIVPHIQLLGEIVFMKNVLIVFAALLALAACEQKKAPAPVTAPAPAVAPAGDAAAPATAPAAADKK